METLHKKADIIAALKMDKRFPDICTGEKCKNCALRRDFALTSSCYPILLKTHKKWQKKALIRQIEDIKHPAPFRSVYSSKSLVIKLYNNILRD